MAEIKQIDGAVKINITNLHFAKVTVNPTTNAIEFGAPERIIGAEQATRKPNVAVGKLFGDGVLRKLSTKKNSMEIDLEINNLPPEWRSYMEGTKVSAGGVESATSADVANFLAAGWEVEKTEGKKELIWFPYCQAEPIESVAQQSEENVVYTRDKVKLMAMEHSSLKRFYSLVDTELEVNKDVTSEQFFKQVVTGESIPTE